jgi:hypothetical protein
MLAKEKLCQIILITTTRNFVFCNLSYATKKSHMQLFWSCIRQVAKDKISSSEPSSKIDSTTIRTKILSLFFRIIIQILLL